MGERDEYDPFYYNRANTLADVIRILDGSCRTFKEDSDGIRVALVAEYLKNGLCRYIQDTMRLLEGQLETGMIAQIVDEAIEYARLKVLEDCLDKKPLHKLEEEKERLTSQLKEAQFRQAYEEAVEKGIPMPRYEKEEGIDPGQEAR